LEPLPAMAASKVTDTVTLLSAPAEPDPVPVDPEPAPTPAMVREHQRYLSVVRGWDRNEY
jgi:hypothetical protein